MVQGPRKNLDRHRNLITSVTSPKMSSKFVQNFLCDQVDKQTDRRTDLPESITSFFGGRNYNIYSSTPRKNRGSFSYV